MIKEHGDLFSDSQCKVCSAVLISESQKLTHYQVSEPTVCQGTLLIFNGATMLSDVMERAAEVLAWRCDYLMHLTSH